MSPNENSTQLLLRPLYTPIDHLKHGIYLQRRDPLLLMQYNSIYTVQHLYTARQSNEPYTPREACDEPLIPHSTRQPGHTRAAFRLPLHLWLGMYIGDLGWGPRTRHLVFTTLASRFSFGVEIMLQAGGLQAYTHIHRAFKWGQGQAHKTLWQSHSNLQSSGSMV